MRVILSYHFRCFVGVLSRRPLVRTSAAHGEAEHCIATALSARAIDDKSVDGVLTFLVDMLDSKSRYQWPPFAMVDLDRRL